MGVRARFARAKEKGVARLRHAPPRIHPGPPSPGGSADSSNAAAVVLPLSSPIGSLLHSGSLTAIRAAAFPSGKKNEEDLRSLSRPPI